MDRETATRARIAALIYTMTNAVIFGAGLIVVMAVPALAAGAAIWIPLVVVASLILAAPAAWFIAPRMRARFGRQQRAAGATPGAAAHPH
jgi:hypothetical protein